MAKFKLIRNEINAHHCFNMEHENYGTDPNLRVAITHWRKGA